VSGSRTSAGSTETVAIDSIVAVTTHARRVPARERARFAAALRRDLPDGVLVLETCHRVEAYGATAGAAARLAEAVPLPAGGEILAGPLAVGHAVRVVVGRDSVVLGEDQIVHQVRTSLEAARAARTLDPTLERLFAIALHAGRRARSFRQGASRSLADVALARIEDRGGPVRGRPLLVVGAGPMGRLAARAAVAAGAVVHVANRSADGALALAAASAGHVEPFDPGADLDRFAGVIVALGGPWPIGPATIDALGGGVVVVVDLSVPAAVPAAAAAALGARLVTADDLARAGDDPGTTAPSDVAPEDPARAARLEALVTRATEDYLAWLAGRAGRTAAEALVRHADLEREAELAALWQRLPDLQPDARAAIEGMSRHLADRLLRRPLERLGRDADGRDGRVVRDLFSL